MSDAKQRIIFYQSMATFIENGYPVRRALTQRFPGKFSHAAKRMEMEISNGATFTAAAEATRCFNKFELCLIKSGESMACLPAIFRNLANWYQDRIETNAAIIGECFYAFVLIYVCGALVQTISCIQGQITLSRAISGTLLFWILFPIAIWLLKKNIDFFSQITIIGIIFEAVPFLGQLLYLADTVRYFDVFSAGISSGVPLHQLLPTAAECCRNGRYKEKFRKFADHILKDRMTISEAFSQVAGSKDIARAIPSMIAAGEAVGTLDDMAKRIAKNAAFDLKNLSKRVVIILTVLINLVIMVYFAIKIISFWVGHYNNLIDSF